MEELTSKIQIIYSILEQMAVTGLNQDLVVTAKAQLRQVMELIKSMEI